MATSRPMRSDTAGVYWAWRFACPDPPLAVHADRRDDGGDGGTRRGPREEGEAERLHARPRPPGEALVTAIDLGQALAQDQADGDVEAHEERHRGRVLGLALRLPRPPPRRPRRPARRRR